MTYHFKRHGHTDIIQSTVTLGQEMESYPIIIWEQAHNKQSEDSECGPQIYMLFQTGGHGFGLKLENLMPVNTWWPCITFRNCLTYV